MPLRSSVKMCGDVQVPAAPDEHLVRTRIRIMAQGERSLCRCYGVQAATVTATSTFARLGQGAVIPFLTQTRFCRRSWLQA